MLKKISPSRAFCSSFLLGFFLADLVESEGFFFLIIGGCVALALTYMCCRHGMKYIFLLAQIGFVVGLLYQVKTMEGFNFRYAKNGHVLEYLSSFRDVLICGKIIDFVEVYPDRIRVTLLLDTVRKEGEVFYKSDDFEGDRIKTYLYVVNPLKTYLYGDYIALTGRIKVFEPFRNPAPPSKADFDKMGLAKGIQSSIYLKNDESIIKLIPLEDLSFGERVYRWADRKRQTFSKYIDFRMKPASGAFVKAVAVGFRHFLVPTLKEITTVSGVQHLFAISGLHLASVAFLAYFMAGFIVKRCFCKVFLVLPKPLLSAVIALPFVVIYVLLSGISTPTLRAVIFVMFYAFGMFVFRPVRPMDVILASAFLMILFDPFLAYSPSFILSFGAVCGIFGVALKLKKEVLIPPSGGIISRASVLFADCFWVSLCIQVTLLPFILYYFYRFSWVGLGANVVLVPWVSLVVLPLVIVLLLSFDLWECAGSLLCLVLEPLVDFTWEMVRFFGQIREAVLWGFFGGFSELQAKSVVCIYCCCLAVLVISLSRRGKSTFFNSIILLVLAFCYQWISHMETRSKGLLEITFFDVGNGNSSWIVFPDGATLLVDGGGLQSSNFDPGQSIIVPFIVASGYRHVDDVLLSHYHYDHQKGLEFVLSSFRASNFLTPLCVPHGMDQGGLEGIARARKINTVPFETLRSYFVSKGFGGASVEVASPMADERDCSDLNDTSTFLVLRFHEVIVLMPGDVGVSRFKRVLEGLSLTEGSKIILLAPHHGSCKSFSDDVFDKIKPHVVVVSSGGRRDNEPCRGLINWCRSRGIGCYLTAVHGGVSMRSDGVNMDFWGVDRKGKPVYLGRF